MVKSGESGKILVGAPILLPSFASEFFYWEIPLSSSQPIAPRSPGFLQAIVSDSLVRHGVVVGILLQGGWALGQPVPHVQAAQAPTPEAILKSSQWPAGLKMELAVSDPMIHSPVAGAFDEKGRLWVVEMPDYPNGPAKGAKPGGAIKILTDTDGDEQFDRADVFAEGLLFANGVLPWKKGAFVTCAPHILWLEDTDGDGKADKKEILFEGFTEGNPQLRVSFPILGPDGWVYVANGLRGGKIKRPNASREEEITLNGLDFRFHPTTLKGEALTGPGQFGNTFDAWGNRFVCDNRHHLRHVVLENRYVKRNPFLATAELVEDVALEEAGPLSSGGKIWPISRNWTTSNLHAGRFTAACGVMAFQGTGLGPNPTGSLFTCDPTGNLVHEERLSEKGGTFRARSPQQGFEFLACSNEWFRPVSMIQGPDGGLWVIDMCRAVIEHPEFMPPELRNRADLVWGKEKGRIWRIRREALAPKKNPLANPAKPADWVAQLGSDEGWVRHAAFRLLLQTGDRSVLADLQSRMLQAPSAQERFLAAWLVHHLGGMHSEQIAALLADKDAHVVVAGLNILETELAQLLALIGPLKNLAGHPDARVRFQVALVAGYLNPADATSILTQVAKRDGADKWTHLAILSSAAQCQKELAQQLLTAPGPASDLELLQDLATQVGVKGQVGPIRELAQVALEPSGEKRQLAVLVGLAVGCRKRGQSLHDLLASWDQEGAGAMAQWKRLLEKQRLLVQNEAAPSAERLKVLPLIAMAGPAGLETLQSVARTSLDLALRLATIREIGNLSGLEGPSALIGSWKAQPPAARREILELMLRSNERILELLKRIESGEISPRELDGNRIRQLLAHAHPEIKKQSEKLLASSLPANRGIVIQAYLTAAKNPGDPERGSQVFAKNCATCHKIGGKGLDVGPDISDTRTKTEIMLLTDILNPSAAIDNNYVGYIATLKNGRTITGMIRSSNASSLTLVRAENQTETVQQNEIEELVSTGQSFMPEGLEKNITVAEMADLLAYLKNWRYLDGKTPLGKEGNK